jgi:hypothetical protein
LPNSVRDLSAALEVRLLHLRGACFALVQNGLKAGGTR